MNRCRNKCSPLNQKLSNNHRHRLRSTRAELALKLQPLWAEKAQENPASNKTRSQTPGLSTLTEPIARRSPIPVAQALSQMVQQTAAKGSSIITSRRREVLTATNPFAGHPNASTERQSHRRRVVLAFEHHAETQRQFVAISILPAGGQIQSLIFSILVTVTRIPRPPAGAARTH